MRTVGEVESKHRTQSRSDEEPRRVARLVLVPKDEVVEQGEQRLKAAEQSRVAQAGAESTENRSTDAVKLRRYRLARLAYEPRAGGSRIGGVRRIDS
mgnify:CR=1 FL=1